MVSHSRQKAQLKPLLRRERDLHNNSHHELKLMVQFVTNQVEAELLDEYFLKL